MKIERWGSLLAFFSWVPLFGDLIAVSLGFFKIDFIKVSTFMLLGKMLRYFIWALMTLWGLSFLNFGYFENLPGAMIELSILKTGLGTVFNKNAINFHLLVGT